MSGCYVCGMHVSCNQCFGFQSGFHKTNEPNKFPQSIRVTSGNGITFVHICSQSCLKLISTKK